MNSDIFLIFRVLCGGVFILTLCAGIYLLRNYGRFFGVDPNMPNENGSSRAYNVMQVFCILVHVMIASGLGVLLM